MWIYIYFYFVRMTCLPQTCFTSYILSTQAPPPTFYLSESIFLIGDWKTNWTKWAGWTRRLKRYKNYTLEWSRKLIIRESTWLVEVCSVETQLSSRHWSSIEVVISIHSTIWVANKNRNCTICDLSTRGKTNRSNERDTRVHNIRLTIYLYLYRKNRTEDN